MRQVTPGPPPYTNARALAQPLRFGAPPSAALSYPARPSPPQSPVRSSSFHASATLNAGTGCVRFALPCGDQLIAFAPIMPFRERTYGDEDTLRLLVWVKPFAGLKATLVSCSLKDI